MNLVVDTNILLSFFRENPVREFIVHSELLGWELYTPTYAISELRANKSRVMKYAGIASEDDFEFILSTLDSFITVPPTSSFDDFELEAKRVSPHIKDSPFFALALKLNCGLWSNEPRLKKQPVVKVVSTKELISFLSGT
jgi:predicted nucleic acid-binding protein